LTQDNIRDNIVSMNLKLIFNPLILYTISTRNLSM